MAGLGYQAVQPANFDVSGLIAEKGRQDAYSDSQRQASQKKDDWDKKEFATPHPLMKQASDAAWMNLLKEKEEIDSITDPVERAKAVSQWNSKKEIIVSKNKQGQEWASTYDVDKSIKELQNNRDAYTTESADAYEEWLKNWGGLWGTDEKGYTFDGKSALEVNSFIPPPKLTKKTESFMEMWVDKYDSKGGMTDFHVISGENYVFSKEMFDKIFDIKMEPFLDKEIYTQEQAEELRKEAYDLMPKDTIQINKNTGNNNDSDKNVTYTINGIGFGGKGLSEKEQQFVNALERVDWNNIGDGIVVDLRGSGASLSRTVGTKTMKDEIESATLDKNGNVISVKVVGQEELTMTGSRADNFIVDNFGKKWKPIVQKAAGGGGGATTKTTKVDANKGGTKTQKSLSPQIQKSDYDKLTKDEKAKYKQSTSFPNIYKLIK